MRCAACQKRGKTWKGADPKCAFTDGVFGENWNCATVNAIREIVYEGQREMPSGVDYQYCEDQKYATVNIDHLDIEVHGDRALALWVTWYKSRGATDQIWLLSSYGPPQLPTEQDLLRICAAFGVEVEG